MIGFIYLIILVLKFLRTLYDGLTALGSIHSARTHKYIYIYIYLYICMYVCIIIFNFLLYLFFN